MAWEAPLDELNRPETRAEVEAVRGSQLWRWVEVYLRERRELLFAEQLSTSGREAAQREGALKELSDLLHHGPLRVVLSRRFKQAEEKASMAAGDSRVVGMDVEPREAARYGRME